MPRFPRIALIPALLAPLSIAAAQAGADYPTPTFGGWGLNPADIDRTVHPGDDFFAYMNGKWARAETIPDAYPYSGNVLALRLESQRAVRSIKTWPPRRKPPAASRRASPTAIARS